MSNDVAKTILQQLGGNRFLTMTGAYSLLGDNQSLRFRLRGGGGRTTDGINLVEITLTPADVYTVAFFRQRAGKLTELHRIHDVYNDQLQSVFTQYTGLYTSLGTLGKQVNRNG